MRISEKNKMRLYGTFSGRIMDYRVELKMSPELAEPELIDARMFKLEQDIWRDIKQALNISD